MSKDIEGPDGVDFETYEEMCAAWAGKCDYFEVNGIPVIEIFNCDGTYSDRYGLIQGRWVHGVPGDSTFFNDGSRLNRAQFHSLLAQLRPHDSLDELIRRTQERRRKRQQRVEKLQPLLDLARTNSEIKVWLHLILDADPVLRIAYMRELGEAILRLEANSSVSDAAIYIVEDWGLETLRRELRPLEASDVPSFEDDDDTLSQQEEE